MSAGALRAPGMRVRPARGGSQAALKLSVYFGERSRSGGRLVADELLDLHERRGTRLSILLRGAQGFGAKHRLRTDRLLTLSEDLPVVAVAVDRREHIESLLEEAVSLLDGGLATVTEVRLLNGDAAAEAAQAGASLREADVTRREAGATIREMDASPQETHTSPRETGASPSEALKLSVYVGRHERVESRPAFAAVCQLLYERGVAGASVLLGVDGTRHGHRERARFFGRNERVPLMILAVGEGEQMAATLSELRQMLPDAPFTIERVSVCKRDGDLLQAPHGDGPGAPHGAAGPGAPRARARALQKLTVVTSEAAVHDGRPVHIELVRRLRATRLAGATSLRGIWGFHGDHAPHGDKLLAVRRHVPIVTTVIDSLERIAQAFPVVDELTAERGLVTSELLPANLPANIPRARL